ncbi:hypothetical protein EXU85_23965 [Spirosoma sp. KCTC 42546]|uniref:hypothetical protein n=1 Tax=Spirosoma sp. KCTC 42546 TaxID=2520506 RepID=UPI00115BF955|nr:hypothetical protein [Spirosoma sp. KCTC 42546]QDK81497.1 hypothetical protein EXU85_23965 [Spirosoma sp. KCTC 42546]
MTHTITIETQSENDLLVFKLLADRLGLRSQETHVEETSLSEAEELRLLERVSWQGDETGDELNAMIQSTRHFGTRDIQL